MRHIRRIAAIAAFPLRFLQGRLASVGPAVVSAPPDAVRWMWGRGRTKAAPLWRRLVRAAVVILGLGIFAALEYELALLIEAEDWFHVGVIAVGIIYLALMLYNQAAGFVIWLVLSPWVLLFWHEAVEGKLALTFDRVVILLLIIIVVGRRLAHRLPMKKPTLAEILLLGSFLYTKVIPNIGGRPSMIWGINVILDSLVSPVVIYLLAKECFRTKRELSAAVTVIFVAGVAWGLSGYYEHFMGKMWLSPLVGFDVGLAERDVAKGRAAGPSAHYYVYGGIMILTILLGLHLATSAKRFAAKLLSAATVPVSVVALYFGYSRAPYSALALSLLLAALMAKRGRWVYASATVATLVAGVLALSTLATSTQTNRFSSLETIYGRAAINRTMLNMIRANFWFGVGVGKSGELTPKYVSSMAHAYSVVNGIRHYKFAHNEYLMIFAEQGIVGFLLFFGALGALMVMIMRVRARLPDSGVLSKNFASVLILLLLSYLMMGFADQFWRHPYLYYVMFAMIGMVARLGEMETEAGDASDRAPDSQQAPLAPGLAG